MIADEQALSQGLGRSIQRQPDPENIKDAKAHCRALCGDNDIALTALYNAIANSATLATIENRCAIGFAAFAARLRKL
jgi:hypothetical protein